jgi:hypothetical protein
MKCGNCEKFDVWHTLSGLCYNCYQESQGKVFDGKRFVKPQEKPKKTKKESK